MVHEGERKVMRTCSDMVVYAEQWRSIRMHMNDVR